MKLLEQELGHRVDCRKCGALYLVEYDDVRVVIPHGMDPVKELEKARASEDELKLWDEYCGRRMYYRFWLAEWICPKCSVVTKDEIDYLPSQWREPLLEKHGFSGMRRPLDHPAIQEIDRLNYERFLSNLRRWEKMWRRSGMRYFKVFGHTNGASDHAGRHGLKRPFDYI